MNLTKVPIRSVQAQLGLMAIAYAGGVALAILAICLRGILFERFIREKYPPVSDRIDVILRNVARGEGSALQLESLARERVESQTSQVPIQTRYVRALDEIMDAVYGAWIEEPTLDARGSLGRSLLSSEPSLIIARIRRTLAAGDLRQRSRVVEFLALGPPTDQQQEWLDLCRHAHTNAWRRGETELADRAVAVLRQLQGERETNTTVHPKSGGERQ
jgi:hypothetical protein